MPLTDQPTATQPTKADVLREWVRRLRSGDYKQGNGRLKDPTSPTGGTEYCCLGVLGEIYNEQHPDQPVQLVEMSYLPNSVWAACVPNAIDRAVYVAEGSQRAPRTQGHWARLNDTARLSFGEIANEVERRLLDDTEGT